jgi:hypothetical protein
MWFAVNEAVLRMMIIEERNVCMVMYLAVAMMKND